MSQPNEHCDKLGGLLGPGAVEVPGKSAGEGKRLSDVAESDRVGLGAVGVGEEDGRALANEGSGRRESSPAGDLAGNDEAGSAEADGNGAAEAGDDVHRPARRDLARVVPARRRPATEQLEAA